jgi:hypothetical protein
MNYYHYIYIHAIYDLLVKNCVMKLFRGVRMKFLVLVIPAMQSENSICLGNAFPNLSNNCRRQILSKIVL